MGTHYIVQVTVQKVSKPERTNVIASEPKRTITELAKVTVREAEFQEAIRKGKAHLDLTGDTVDDDTTEDTKVYRN